MRNSFHTFKGKGVAFLRPLFVKRWGISNSTWESSAEPEGGGFTSDVRAEAAVSSLPAPPLPAIGFDKPPNKCWCSTSAPSILASVEGRVPKRASMRSGTAWERMLDAFIMSIWDNDKPFINNIDRNVLQCQVEMKCAAEKDIPSRCCFFALAANQALCHKKHDWFCQGPRIRMEHVPTEQMYCLTFVAGWAKVLTTTAILYSLSWVSGSSRNIIEYRSTEFAYMCSPTCRKNLQRNCRREVRGKSFRFCFVSIMCDPCLNVVIWDMNRLQHCGNFVKDWSSPHRARLKRTWHHNSTRTKYTRPY